jgi:hypothetical protein
MYDALDDMLSERIQCSGDIELLGVLVNVG